MMKLAASKHIKVALSKEKFTLQLAFTLFAKAKVFETLVVEQMIFVTYSCSSELFSMFLQILICRNYMIVSLKAIQRAHK